jgi:hypothetical protein
MFKKLIENNQKKSKGKSVRYQHMDLKNLKKKMLEPKVSRLLPNVCDFQKENHTLGYGFKNLKKIYGLAHGFSFFVIISESGTGTPKRLVSEGVN